MFKKEIFYDNILKIIIPININGWYCNLSDYVETMGEDTIIINAKQFNYSLENTI